MDDIGRQSNDGAKQNANTQLNNNNHKNDDERHCVSLPLFFDPVSEKSFYTYICNLSYVDMVRIIIVYIIYFS